MAKQLNVNLAFTADTSAARQQLQNLQTQLSQLANTPVTLKNGGITQEIINASNAAAELKIHLEQATNIQTGNLDFSKLNQSIKNSGSSLAEYGEKLKSLGPAGNTAFQALAQSVAKAEIPIRRSNAALTNMWTTLKNTARWQMSSSMLHGFMGAVQSAFGYAQDLNESLNNIRIVTGQNIDQMARFAEQANKAAKSLSTTTTEYTNASLIYYQQGLSDSEVAARTEVTIKMANAAGQSAQVVSDQLTAVWNNFAKGGENLEYYADVMTALGAATASSTDEISEGLNKFASVAETVGLSYEYAASALATVTATTRQSADVVGTAFKTLFARIQDLELGKTLDDGTTLGSYSQALQKVGVNIKDANGEMKAMDTILSEMAAKWDTLNKDQQVALAQSVAGVRQYTQLVALMDNWDFMEQNLETSYGATGTLNEQAEIYAESWEAAQKRVSAAAESIYSDLLNDEFFIDVLNGFEKFLTLVDKVIDSMGGLQGVLAGVSALMLKIFSSQISQSLTDMTYSIQMMTKSGRQKIQDEQTSFIQNAATSLNPSDETTTVEGATREASLRNQLQLQVDMIANSEKMSAQEMQVNQMLLDRVRLLGEEVALKAQAVDLAQEEVATASTEARADAMYAAQAEAGYENRGEARKKGSDDYTKASTTLRSQVDAEAEILTIIKQIQSAGSASTSQIEALEAAINKMDSASNGTFKGLVEDELNAVKQGESVEMGLREIAEAAKIVVDETGKKGLLDIGVKEENVERVTAGYRQQAKVIREKNDAVDQESQVIDDLSNRIINAQGVQKSWADSIVASAQNISSLSMGISSLGSIVDTIQNPDMSGWEKFTSILMSLSMGIPMLISGLTGLNTTLGLTSAAQAFATLRSQDYINAHKASIATLTEETLAEHAAALAKEAHISKKQAEAILIRASTAAKLEELAATGANIAAMTAEQLAEKTGMTMDQASVIISKMKAGATLQEAMTEAGLTGVKMGGVAASVASFVAKQAEAGATWAQVVANIALQASMAPLLVITLLLVAAIAAIAAIIWVVVSAVQSITAAYNADAIAAENAADAAKNLAAAYKEAKAEYDDMISAMDNYQSARDGLDSLTEGTLEYQEALNKANEAALELIEAGNLVKGQDYTVENGEIIISDEAMQSAKEKKFNEVQDAYAASVMANAKAAQAQAKSNQTDLVRQNDGNAIGIATAAGAAIGSIIPGISTAIGALGGAVIGAIGGAIYNGVDNSIENGKIDELTALYDQIGEAAFDSATLQELGFDTANQAYINSVKDVVRETNAAAEQMEVAAELAATAVLEKNEAYQNSKHQDKIAGAAGKGYQSEYEKAYEEAMKQTKNDDWFGIGSEENKAAMEEYAKQMGLNDLNGFKVTNYKKGGNVEYEYIDENGQKQTIELTQQQIAAQLAATEASQRLAEQTQTLLNTFNRLEGSTNKADQALADFASGDLSGASKSEFEDMESELAGSITTDENGNRVLSDQGALDYINANFSAEELQAMGYESAEEAAEAFKKQFNANLKAWDSIELPENLVGTKNMSLKTAQNFENALTSINLGPAGEQAGADFVDGINKMVKGLNVEDQQAALEELSNIDWSDWDALEQADAIMKEYGVDIDTASSEWQKFAEEMRIAAGATPDFSQLRDTLISITAILQDLDFGSVISEEDYQKLVQYNDEWERFFMLQANGTRVFIGDSNDMQQALQEDLLQKQKDLQARKEAQEGFEEANWGHYDETGENWVKADWNNISGSDTGTAANLIKSSGATEDMLEQLGYTDDIIQGFIDQATSGQEDLVAEGQASLREMYKRIGEFSKEDLDALDKEYKEMIASTATNVDALKDLLNDDLIDEEQYSKQLKVLASQATKFRELSNLKEAGLDAETYGDSLVKLGSQYTDCVDEINAYNKALKSDAPEDAEKALKELEKAVKKSDFEKFAKDTLDFLESLKDDAGWANNIENINKLRESYQYILNTDFTGFSEGFLKSTENINLMTEALKGSDEAWDQLKLNAATEIFNFAGISGTLRTELDAVTAMIAGYDFGDIEIGTDLNDTPFWDALSQMEIGSIEAAQAITDGLSSMGVDAELEKHEVTVPAGATTTKKEGYYEYIDNSDPINPVKHSIPISSSATQTEEGTTYTWYTLKGAKYNGNGVTPPEPPERDRNPGGGGGGSKPKKATPTKKSNVVQRYKGVEDKLDDIRDEADRTKSSLDRLYGAEHEAAIQRLLELEQQEIDLLKEKEQEARNYLQEDLKELKTVSAEVDVEFKFDDKGNIENYEEEMTELYEELAEIQRKAGDEWDENEQKEIDALNEKIQKLEEAMAAYEETRELLEDINAELDAFKGKPALPLITSDTLDIYWEINDALDDIDEKIKDLERKAEGLSGEEKLKVLEEINRLEQERVTILQQQAEANQKDIEEKRAALDELARLNGLQFEYDEETGNITNYLEQMGILQAQLDELHAKKAADGLSPAEEEAMNSIIAKMEELADLAGDYRDAVEESEDILNEIEDTLSGVVADPFVRSDFVDIFKETNDQLDDIDRKISKLQNEADKLTGEARRKKLNEIVTLERQRVKVLEQQAEIARAEIEDRKRAMEEIAARQELMFEYDENQNITNYQEQLDVLIDKYEEAYNKALGDDGLVDATEQAILDSISDDIDHLEEFIQAYCDAVEQLEDIEDEREEVANSGYVDMSQLDDIADELHDINQSLDDLQELLDDSARAADRLYGEARIKQMEKNASLLQQEIDLLQQKKTAQDDIIAKEKQQLDEKTGGYIKYDEYGRITNYDSYINAREDQIREYEAALQEGGLSETEATLLQDEIDLLNEQIAAMEDYEQALEEKEDIQNQIEDAYYEWQDLNAEKLQYKLELQLDVNDRELAKIERAIKRLDGNFYSRAEALALMVGGGMNGDSKLGNYNKQLADLEAHYQEVKRQYEAGEISQAKYVEMTKKLQAEIESTADAMAALQDQMDSYYKDTLAQARQELNFHISQLTHLTGILNHFKNTLTALGKSKDYEMMGTVLEGQVQALENEVKASKNAMQMWQKEADSIYQKYQQALSSGNQENADMYYNAYKEALSAANEAENKFYQQSAAWANALKALMENTLAGLAQDLENALTGGTSFDTITTQMKRASSLQEEYLTTTNKIYETTKLMRTAQQEIDKTTNSVAKRKLSQFITETKQMQSQNKLSKYELSIQQAKYDLLVAEIALEEARMAKSTVRLRRDSEGNFGYVYTADAQAIATAEQKFEDAQNKLYNIGLDGANKYTEKYQQTLAEMYNTLTSLQTKYLQGGFESEAEYNAAVLEAKEYYYEKLNQYSELYSVAINAESGTLTDTLVNNSGIVTDALTKNSRIAADAWSTDFADMTTKTDQWMVAVTDYLSQVQNAFADWEVESQRIANETVGTDLTTLKNKVSDIVTESDNLTAAIGDENSGVIKAIYDEITAVSGLVAEYSNLNGQLTQAIQNALDLSDALQQDIDQAGQDENPPGQYAPGEEESQKPGTVVPEGTDPLPEIELPEDPPHEHYYVKSKTSPTCTEKGYTTYTCSCGDTYDGDFIDALGHDYTSKVIEEATYERGNLIRYTCQRCGDTYEEYDNNKKDKPKVEGSGKVENPVEPIKPEPPPTKPAEPAKPDNSDKVEGVAASIWMDGSDVSGWGTGNTRKNRLKEKGVSKAQDYINKHAENGDIYAAWHNKRSQLKQYYYGKFDTGGYTGAWGPEGKWAMLHEKEIVLNKEDTKNFLASLELLDNILSTIDLHAMNSQWASNLISPDVSSIGKETLEQMVNIEASFPNATDKHEIEEAFKDLVNLASQYANRK